MNNLYISGFKFKNNLPNDSYINRLPVIEFLKTNNEMLFDKNVVFLVGENGSGKSTLIESIAIAYGFNAEGGSKNFNFTTHEVHYDLPQCITLYKSSFPNDGFFFRAESFYNLATNIDELGVTGYGDLSLHDQSHGESFMSLFFNRFRGNGLYILDEPEAALSPLRQMTLLAHIINLSGNNSQFIISTHSPILLACPNSQIFQLSGESILEVSYSDTETVQIYKQFLNNPERMIKHLTDC